jgi:hypothetical protein
MPRKLELNIIAVEGEAQVLLMMQTKCNHCATIARRLRDDCTAIARRLHNHCAVIA